MNTNKDLSRESKEILYEIIQNKSNPNYWQNRFDDLDNQNVTILRGCFKELIDAEMIDVEWASSYPYSIKVLSEYVAQIEPLESELIVPLESLIYVPS